MQKKPHWDDFQDLRMTVPLFIYGQEDIDVGPLHGICRGYGPISGDEKTYQDTIGIYTTDGVYHGIVIDTRCVCAVPQFVIGGVAFYFPIVACQTFCGGVSAVDPLTGDLLSPCSERKELEE